MRTATVDAMEIVKATAPALEKHGVKITTAMYARLFENAEVKEMFDEAAQESGEQPRRLAAAILAYAKNIDKLQNLGPAVHRMVARHVEVGVKPEHYPYVARSLAARHPRRAGCGYCHRCSSCSVGRSLLDACGHPDRGGAQAYETADAA